MKIRIIMACRE